MDLPSRALNVIVAGPTIPGSALLRAAVIAEGGSYQTALDGKDCLAMVRRSMPDLVLIELAGMRVDCIEALRFLRAEEESRDLPVVIVCGRDDAAGRAEALYAGATEFLCQPFDDAEVRARVRAAMMLARFRERVESMRGQLSSVHLNDTETGVLRRSYIDQRIAAEVKSARRHQHALSIIAVRLEPPFGAAPGFDYHPYTRSVADAIKNLVRDEDLVARYEGREFLVVLPHTDSYGSLMLAERIRAAVEHLPGVPRRISASVGVASCQKADDFLRESPLKRAQSAMEKASLGGGNRVVKVD